MYRTRVGRSTLFHVAFTAVLVLTYAWDVPAQTRSPAPPRPNCDTACRVNPVTAPKECGCLDTAPPPAAAVVIGGGQPSTPAPGAEPPPGAPATDGIVDLMLASYEREVAGIDHYYYVETMDIFPRPTVLFFEKKVEAGRSVFKGVPLPELAKREQLADPTLSADQREIAKRPQALLGGYADALDHIAKGLGADKLAKPFTDGLRSVEIGLDADQANPQDSADDVGGLLGDDALQLFSAISGVRSYAMMQYSPSLNLVPQFLGRYEVGSPSAEVISASIHDTGPVAVTNGNHSYPCVIASLPANTVVEGIPHRLVSADMWICKVAPGVLKPVRTRVEYVTNAGVNASPADLIVGGTRPVVIDQMSFDHLAVGTMHPAQKIVQAISGMSDDPRVVRKIRQGFTLNKTPTQAEIAKLIGEALAGIPQ